MHQQNLCSMRLGIFFELDSVSLFLPLQMWLSWALISMANWLPYPHYSMHAIGKWNMKTVFINPGVLRIVVRLHIGPPIHYLILPITYFNMRMMLPSVKFYLVIKTQTYFGILSSVSDFVIQADLILDKSKCPEYIFSPGLLVHLHNHSSNKKR